MDIGNLTAQQNLRSILGWIVTVPLPTTVIPAAGVVGGGGVERVGFPLSLPQETRKSASIKSETVCFIGDVHPHVIPPPHRALNSLKNRAGSVHSDPAQSYTPQNKELFSRRVGRKLMRRQVPAQNRSRDPSRVPRTVTGGVAAATTNHAPSSARLIVIDPAGEAFAGEHNNVSAVREFCARCEGWPLHTRPG